MMMMVLRLPGQNMVRPLVLLHYTFYAYVNMLQNIPPELSLASFSAIGILTGYIWNDQSKKIDALKKVQEARPCHIVANTLAQIQTDIEWIKKNLK